MRTSGRHYLLKLAASEGRFGGASTSYGNNLGCGKSALARALPNLPGPLGKQAETARARICVLKPITIVVNTFVLTT